MLQAQSPFQQFFDLSGAPLQNGVIYIGQPGQNPETAPLPVYWDEAGSIPAVQPFRTIGGYVARSGTPARIYVDEADYSITVRNQKGELVAYCASVTAVSYNRIGQSDGSSFIGFIQSGAGAVAQTAQGKMRQVVSIVDFGGSTGASAATNDAAIAAALAVSNSVFVPAGTFNATTASAASLKSLYGPGFIQINSNTIPCGDIASNLTLTYSTVFSSMSDIFAYLSPRSILPSATVTISIPTGTFTFTGNGIEPYHPDGERINIVGAGSGLTTLRFTGLGAASGKAGVRLIGNYSLGLLDGVTLDGDNWNGHSSGGPTLGAGDPNDPMGVQAKNGASIILGSDVKVLRFARNGIFAYQNASIKADYCICTECGSDAFVASMSSDVRAISAQAIDGWGVGFYADYNGVIWAYSSTASGTKYRGGSVGGDGYAANYGGTIYADYAQAIKNIDTGFTCVTGTILMSNAIAGGSAINANSGYGIRVQSGGRVYGQVVNSSYNAGGGILVTAGSTFAGDTPQFNNNTGVGALVTDGSTLASATMTCNSNTSHGVQVDRGGHASITACSIFGNGGSGINVAMGTVRATGATAISSNAQYGVISRYAGTVDMQGVSVAAVITGNGSGAVSPANDTTTGITQSQIYANA